MHHFPCAGLLLLDMIFQALTVENSTCKSCHRLNHCSALIIGDGNKETDWDSNRWYIYLCEHVTEYYFRSQSLWAVHCISSFIQYGLVDNKITWHVLYFLLVMHIHWPDWWHVCDSRTSQTHTHVYIIANTHVHTLRVIQLYRHTFWTRICPFPLHLCFNPSAKTLSSKIWLDIFQHWISRESRLARRRPLLENGSET